MNMHLRTFLFLLAMGIVIPAMQAQHMDIRWLRSIQANPTAFQNDLSSGFSASVYPVAAAAPVGLFAVGWIKKDKALQQQGLVLAGVLVANTVLTQTTKRLVDRPRPFVRFPDIVNHTSESGRYSFPSGHASTAWATATYLSLEYPRWYVIAPAVIWSVGASWARMYEGVHYPSDVLVGALVGAGTAVLGKHLRRKIFSDQKHLRSSTPNL